MENLSSYIDHTLLSANATNSMVKQLCEEAKEFNFYSVCINSSYVKDAKEFLKNSNVKVCSVVGFPLGAMNSKAKIFETNLAIKDGANEIDMVINVAWLKDKKYEKLKNEISNIRIECKDIVLKVILETALLDTDEIITICKICKDIKVDFVKTSTGFSSRGASVEDINIMKSIVKDDIKIKASGGIRTYDKAIQMINAGANRLGTSASIDIVTKKENENEGY